MKNRRMKAMIGVLATVLLVGCNSMTAGKQEETVEASTTDSTTTDDGLNKWDNTEVYYIQNTEDFNALTPILENRNGKIIIEVIEGTVLDSEGNGIDTCGYYVKYDTEKFSEGDKVQTVLIYNPNTNYIDDILYRIDTLI